MVNPTDGSAPSYQPKDVQSDELTAAQKSTINTIMTHMYQLNHAAALSLMQNMLTASPPLPPAYKNQMLIAVETLKSAQQMWGHNIGGATFGYDLVYDLVANYPLSNTPPNIPVSVFNTANQALVNNPPDWQGFSNAFNNINPDTLPEGYGNLMELCQQSGGSIQSGVPIADQLTMVGWFNRMVQVLHGSGLPPT